jgi:OOP family OmpA-OmpF porin
MRKLVLIVVVAIGLATPALTAEKGIYLGAGFGVSSLDVRDFTPEYADLRLEQSDLGVKLFAGWRVSNFFAVEVGYTNFGDVRQWEGGNLDFYKQADIGVSMLSAEAVGLIPLSDKFDFFGKLGYASRDLSIHTTSDGVTEDLSTSGWDPTLGIGLAIRFKKFGGRIEGDWLQIPDAGQVFLLSASLTYIF